jgi:protein SCO1/2
MPIATFVTLAIAAFVYFQGFGRSAIRLPKPDLGMPFVLNSSKGGMVDSRSLRGKPYAMFFGFTHCPEVCPTTIYEMSSSLERLGAQAEEFKIFFVTVDPERDTTESLRDYLSNFDPRIEGLVPTVEQLPKLASAYRIYLAKIPTSDGGYTMDHSALVYLFDGNGHYADMIPYGAPAETRDRKLRELLAAPPA